MEITSDHSTREESAKRQLKELITEGKISVNGYLPSIRNASRLLKLNRDAIWKAYRALEDERLIERTENGRYRLDGDASKTRLQKLAILVVAVGEGSIRFSGIQRFYNYLAERESAFGISLHSKCVLNAHDIRPEWMEGMDCAVICGSFGNPEVLNAATANILSVGIINSHDWNPDICIDSDDQHLGRISAQHLFKKGIRNPCVVAYGSRERRRVLRKLGFQACWLENGGSTDEIGEYWIDPSCLYTRVNELHDLSHRLIDEHDAVYCLEKQSAIDLMNLLARIEVKIPSKLRIISTDGTFAGLKTKPKLTIVRQQFEEMASQTIEKIRLALSDPNSLGLRAQQSRVMLPGQLIEREST